MNLKQNPRKGEEEMLKQFIAFLKSREMVIAGSNVSMVAGDISIPFFKPLDPKDYNKVISHFLYQISNPQPTQDDEPI